MKIYDKYIKRFLDFIISFLLLITLSPLFLVLYLLIRFKLGSPVFFSQNRPGKDEKIFKMYKFRSMTNERDEFGELLPDEMRLPKFGEKLRSTSLDELPELWNILKGDMSLIGPRPLLVEYLSLYDTEQKKRHLVRPGLTGWAQVNGRNSISWEKKFSYDIEYVNNISFGLDARIIFLTIIKVIKKADISGKNSVTVKKFSDEKDNKNEYHKK